MIVLVILIIISIPVLGGIGVWWISEMYMQYLHNKPNPTKEEWKIKR